MKYKTTGELKAIAREQLKGKYGTAILVTLLYGLISFGLSMITSVFYSNPLVSMGMAIIISLITTVLALGMTKLYLNIAKDEEYQVMDLFWGFSNHPDKVIVATLLLLVLLLIPTVIMIVFIVFFAVTKSNFALILLLAGCIAAGVLIVVLGLAYNLYSVILADNKEVSAIEALRISRELMQGNKLRMFYLSLTFIGWSLLGLISLGIAYLWITPYISVTSMHFYLDIKEKKQLEAMQNNTEMYI